MIHNRIRLIERAPECKTAFSARAERRLLMFPADSALSNCSLVAKIWLACVSGLLLSACTHTAHQPSALAALDGQKNEQSFAPTSVYYYHKKNYPKARAVPIAAQALSEVYQASSKPIKQ